MRGGSAWRLCLFVFLLTKSRAEDSSRANSQGQSDELHLEEVRKSGAPNDIDNDSGDSIDGQSNPFPGNVYLGPAENQRISFHEQHYGAYEDMFNNYPYKGDEISNSNGYIPPYNNVYSPRLDSPNIPQLQTKEGVIPATYINGMPTLYGQNPLLEANDALLMHDPSAGQQLVQQQELVHNLYNGGVFQDDPSALIERESHDAESPNQEMYLQSPYQPVVVSENEQHAEVEGNIDLNLSAHGSVQRLISRLVPVENLINLHNIPGGKTALTCSNVGEIYHFWNGLNCLVCVCLKEGIFKPVKPVCVSCAACSGPTPEPPHTYVPPTPYEPVTLPPVPAPDTQASCKPLPVNVPFQSPLDPCKVCICTESINMGKVEATIQCERNPECVIPPDVTTVSPSPDTPIPLHVCDKFPKNVLFPHPGDQCKLCKCSVVLSARGQYEQQIICYHNPDCHLPEPVTEPTETVPTMRPEPEPYNICVNYPINTVFTHPYDRCRECQCYHGHKTAGPAPELQIQCRMKPECVPSPEPIVTPEPTAVTCSPIPSGVPFQNPLNPCQICICSETTDPFGRPDVFIKCDESPDCVVSPDVTIPPIDVKPVPLRLCSEMPNGVPFPHPRDTCKLCKCTVQQTPVGPREYISCYTNPECEMTPTPMEPSICDRYPPNTLFPDPQDECRVCRCTVHKTIYGQTERHINCYITPECSGSTISPVTVQPSTPYPDKDESCAPLPSGRPFQNPLNPCQVCVCQETWGAAGPDVNIECRENPHCVIPPDVITVPPIHNDTPVPLPICAKFPSNVTFPHPRDACRLCKCTVQVTPYGAPREYITCFANPECEPTLEPFTIAPPEPIDALTCKPLPSGRPFQNPLNPCEICVCIESLNSNGNPNVRIECRENHQCVIPPEVVTEIPIIPDNKSVPLPICAKLPPHVLFPHPLDSCRLCKCTVQVTPYGVPKEYITCFPNPECETTEEIVTKAPPEPALTCKPLPSGKPFQNPLNPCEICVCIESLNVHGQPSVRIECQENPQCIIPPETTTVPIIPDNKPIPLPICAKFPSNVLFPHPRDACRLCKCTVQVTPYGAPREYITCFANPECETTPAPTPWPPAPPGPLPGPSPHESCSPYAPNRPFQHPWDECQVCVCSEAISIGHITIEVNCFTKKSCCIEIPFDLSELPSSSTGPYIIRPKLQSGVIGDNAEGSIAIGADGQQVNLKEILDPNNIGHYLKPTGHLGPILSGYKNPNRPGGGNIYIQDQPDQLNLIANNDIVQRGRIKVVTNPAQNGELFDVDNIDLYSNKLIQPGVSGYEELRIPGYVYSGNVKNSQYKIPIDIRNSQLKPGSNKYISFNGQAVPGYIDQRYMNHFYQNIPVGAGSVSGHVNPFAISEDNRQEYNIISQGNIMPGGHLNGHISANGAIEDLSDGSGAAQTVQIRPGAYTNQYIGGVSSLGYAQNSLQTIHSPPTWYKLSPYGSISGATAANIRGMGKMRTKSGRPGDSSQSEESSVAAE